MAHVFLASFKVENINQRNAKATFSETRTNVISNQQCSVRWPSKISLS